MSETTTNLWSSRGRGALTGMDTWKKMMTSTGILGATKDDYLTHVPNTTGQDPYVLKSLNPDFVRVAKA